MKERNIISFREIYFVLLVMEERENKHQLIKFYQEIHNQLNVIDQHH